jgi:hypothetical protein
MELRVLDLVINIGRETQRRTMNLITLKRKTTKTNLKKSALKMKPPPINKLIQRMKHLKIVKARQRITVNE